MAFALPRARAAPVEVVNVAAASYVSGGIPVTTPSGAVRTVVAGTTSGEAPTINYYRSNSFTETISTVSVNGRLYVQASAPDCDTDSTVIETHNIIIISKKTGDRESFEGVESAPDSGIFRIASPVQLQNVATHPVVSGNEIIETTSNDTLTAEIVDCGGVRATTTILIDPAGIVFDSKTNLPVAGAKVTLINANSGAPALVFQADGTTSAPSTVTTGADGLFEFPTVSPGTYRLVVIPPPGYRAPSQVRPGDLPAGRIIHVEGSYGGNFAVSLATGAVTIDYPVDPDTGGASGLFIQKLASRTTVEVGDFVDYSVRVKNVSEADMPDVRVEDRLPFGFSYQDGSARVAGHRVENPAGGAGPRLEFQMGAIESGATVELRYRLRVGPGSLQGDGTNEARARSDSPSARSNLARVKVELKAGVFTDRGIIIGKVYVDENANRVQDAGESGVPGVRIFLEDGSYIITDSEGKYSFYGISPRNHVLKVDNTTLPPGAELQTLSTRDARRPGTQFVDLLNGEMHKADFALVGTPEIIDYVRQRRAKSEALTGEIESNLRDGLTRSDAPLATADPRSLPASGVRGVGTERYRGGEQLPEEDSIRSRVLGGSQPGFAGTVELNGNRPAARGSNFSGILSDDVSVAQPSAAPLPAVDLETAVGERTDSLFGFIDPQDGDTLPMKQTTVRVQFAAGATAALLVNGQEVSGSRLGKRITIADRRIEAAEFIGVDLRPGENILALVQRDGFGNERGRQEIKVIAPDKLGKIRLSLPAEESAADGRTPVPVRVELLDEHDVPVTARTPLTLESSRGQWDVDDLNKAAPGVQVFIQGGRAEYKLLPPVEPGDAEVRVSSGVLESRTTVSFLPELRPMLAVGIVEGRINLNGLNTSALEPARSSDGFQEELREFAINGNDKTSAAGRTAFFLKGRIKGEYLLTAAYDSEKDTKERLFRDIQPDEFYPVYGDSSVKGFEAQSTGRLYVRIDNRRSYLLYGDFNTQSSNEARTLSNYSRSLTGVREHFENKHVRANAWAAYDTTRQVIEELRANGTSGPYMFRTANGLTNSEKVEILIRDRNQPGIIVKTVSMARFSDYEFEPFTGRILFKEPIPSLDENLNPVSIRVTYEADQGGDKFWVYGADAQVKVHPRVELGGTVVRDENPINKFQLWGANAAFDLGLQTYLYGEFAHTDDELEGSGDAQRIELRHNSDRLSARLYWGRADETFNNPSAQLSSGRVESGADAALRISEKLQAIVQAIRTEAIGGGVRQGVVAGFEYAFTKDVRLEIGGRYSTETADPASLSTALTPGVTPNEVRSVRAKLTLPVPYMENARVFGEYEQDVTDSGRRLAAFGGDLQLENNARLYARHEFISSLGGPFELNGQQEQNQTVVGTESEYMKDGKLFNEYRARSAFEGRQTEAAIGLRNAWKLADGVSANTSFERIAPLEGNTAVENSTESTAATAAIEITTDPDWKASARLEGRTSGVTDSILNTLGFAAKITQNWTFLGQSILFLSKNKGPDAGDRNEARVRTGLAWRQTDANRWNALARYEFKTENDSTDTEWNVRRQVHIVSADVNYQPTADLILSGHYAGKIAFENSNGDSDTYDAHLISARVTYDLTSRWDVGMAVSAMFSGRDGSVHYGISPEVGFIVADNIRLGLGYTFFGFSDEDLAEEEYNHGGFYIALRMKFDETVFDRKKGEARP